MVVGDMPANRQLVDTGVEGIVIETRRWMGAAANRERFSTDRVVELYERLLARILEQA